MTRNLRALCVALVGLVVVGMSLARAQDVQFSYDGALIAKLDEDRYQHPKIDIWDTATGERRSVRAASLLPQKARVLAAAFAFSPTAPLLAVVAYGFIDDDGLDELTVYDTATWRVVSRFRARYPGEIVFGLLDFVPSISISPDGERLSFLSSPADLRIYSFSGEGFARQSRFSPQATGSAGPIRLLGRNTAVVIEPFSDEVAFVDVSTGAVTRRVAGACEPVESTVFAAMAVLSCQGAGGRLQWIDLPRGTHLQSLDLGVSIGFASAMPDRRSIIATSDGRARIIDRDTGVELRSFGLRGTNFDGAISPDGSRLATVRFVRRSGSVKRRDTIDLYDLATGAFIKSLH